MHSHRHLPFLGLLLLASIVAMAAGVGDVSERTSAADRTSSAAQAPGAADEPAVRPGRRDP